MSELELLKERSAALVDASAEAIDVNRRLLAIEPGNLVATIRLGRFLHDTGQLPEALEAFRSALALDPWNAIAQRRVQQVEREIERAPSRRGTVVGNRQGGGGALVRRRARKFWRCQGAGTPAKHAVDCPHDIAPGDTYVDIQWGRVDYLENHRVSLACAVAFWGDNPFASRPAESQV